MMDWKLLVLCVFRVGDVYVFVGHWFCLVFVENVYMKVECCWRHGVGFLIDCSICLM